MEKKIKKVVAFDFDDTLAVTNSHVGIRSNLLENAFTIASRLGLDIASRDEDWIWVNSTNYETFLSFSSVSISDFEYDYSETMAVDLDSVSPIPSMIIQLKEYLADPDCLVIILTARAGYTDVWSPVNKCVIPSTNREGIASFLNSQGIIIPDHHIHTVGDVAAEGGLTSVAKANVLSHYAIAYQPEEIIFYDDSERNIARASKIHLREGVNSRITLNYVKDGHVARSVQSNKGLKQWLYRIFKTMLE